MADAVALSAIAARITEFGFTPNRVAALGMNVVLLVILVWSASSVRSILMATLKYQYHPQLT